MTSTPTRMFDELGRVAARWNENAGRHTLGCCTICRKVLQGIIQALLDPDNWVPESPHDAIRRLQEELEAMKARLIQPSMPLGPIQSQPPPPEEMTEEQLAEIRNLRGFPPQFRTEE